jgi:hypothetical protein
MKPPASRSEAFEYVICIGLWSVLNNCIIAVQSPFHCYPKGIKFIKIVEIVEYWRFTKIGKDKMKNATFSFAMKRSKQSQFL